MITVYLRSVYLLSVYLYLFSDSFIWNLSHIFLSVKNNNKYKIKVIFMSKII